MSVYQDQVYVPLLVKPPGGRGDLPAVVDAPASSVDVFATVLEACGIPVPEEVAGGSLLAPPARRAVFAEHYPFERLARREPRLAAVERAVVEGSRKLVRSAAGKRELYDLERDPDERASLAGVDSAAAAALDGALERWLAATSPAPVDTVSLDADARERLRALGYVQ
jgi:arylsulfatase A-like enzyme